MPACLATPAGTTVSSRRSTRSPGISAAKPGAQRTRLVRKGTSPRHGMEKARHGVRSDRRTIQDKAMAQMPPVRPAAGGTCVLFSREGNRNRTRAGKPGHCHDCIVRRSAGNPRSTAFPPGARRPCRRVHACVSEPGDPFSFPAAVKPAWWRKTKRVHLVRPRFHRDADLRIRVSVRPA